MGQGGNGTPLSTPVPSAVAGEHQFSYVAPGSGGHGCGLNLSGDAYCWGSNLSGQLGIGGSTDWLEGARFTPVPVSGNHKFRTLSVTPFSDGVCGLDTDSAAYCWGRNGLGELGIGTTTGPDVCEYQVPCSKLPAAVAGGHRFASIYTGYSHTCALTSTGAAYCWGQNHAGALGDGSEVDRSVPTPVGGGLSFVELALGANNTCGLTASGVVYCWGSNDYGRLGVGTTTGPQVCTGGGPCSLLPVRIAGDIQFARISAGNTHTCALRPSGVMYCWGNNNSGQLGTGTLQELVPAPVPVDGGLTFTELASGGSYTCGVTVANVAYCWGANQEGQLGTGTTDDSRVPVRVAGQP